MRVTHVSMRYNPPYAGGVVSSVHSLKEALGPTVECSTLTSNFPPMLLLKVFRHVKCCPKDIIHTHSARSGLLDVVQRITARYNVPHVHTAYAELNGTKVMPHVHLAYAFSRSVGRCIPSGVDLDVFVPDAIRERYVLALGSNESRDVDKLVKFSYVLSKLDIGLVWVVSEKKHFVKYWRLAPNLDVLPLESCISLLMGKAKAYVLFLKEERAKYVAALPNSVLEALACGTPVLTSGMLNPPGLFGVLPITGKGLEGDLSYLLGVFHLDGERMREGVHSYSWSGVAAKYFDLYGLAGAP